MSDLVRNPKDRFSHDMAQIKQHAKQMINYLVCKRSWFVLSFQIHSLVLLSYKQKGAYMTAWIQRNAYPTNPKCNFEQGSSSLLKTYIFDICQKPLADLRKSHANPFLFLIYFTNYVTNNVSLTSCRLRSARASMSLVVRKPVLGISDLIRHKPGCTAKEDG